MQIQNFYAQDVNGNIVPGATCSLFLPGTTTLATGLQDVSGAPMANPFSANADGLVQFAAPNGKYDLKIEAGLIVSTLPVVFADTLEALNQLGGFLPPSATPPVTREDGSPLQPGDRYYNTAEAVEYIFISSVWTANNVNGADIANKEDPLKGASLVGFDDETVSDVLKKSKKLADYDALRNYSGISTMVEITKSDIFGTYADIGVVSGYVDSGGDFVISTSGHVWKRISGEIIDARWYGEPSESTMQAMLNAAAGKTLVLDGSKTYPFQNIEIASNTKIITHGAKLSRIMPSTTHGITINSCIEIDSLTAESPGGITGDKIFLIKGDLVKIGSISGVAQSEGSFTSANWLIEMESRLSGTTLKDISIGSVHSKNYRTAFFATNVDGLEVGFFDVETYRLAVYLKDASNSSFPMAYIRGKSATLTGDPGENGLLVESTIAKYSANNLKFSNWIVEDSGEHCYRLGGNLAMRDIYFEDCKAIRPGQAWTVGYPLATEWHGGCGFKGLGGTAVAGQRHKNVHFTRCNVYDCSMNFGTFPAGHGVNNFSAFLLSCMDDVFMTECGNDAINQTYSARNTLLISSCDRIRLNNNNLLKASMSSINPYEENQLVSEGYAGLAFGVNDLEINGGVYEVSNTTAGAGIPFNAIGTAYENKNWTARSVRIRGGSRAIYVTSPTTGSYNTGIVEFDFTYSASNSNDSTYGTPVVDGAAVGLLTCRAPWRPSAYSPSSLNGSIWQDTLGGNFRRKAGGAWAIL